MKVAILTVEFPPDCIGGVSAWSSDMALALVEAGHSVEVFTKKRSHTHEHDQALPFQVTRVRGRSWAKWGSLWMQIALWKRLHQFDIILAANWSLTTRIHTHKGLCLSFHGSDISTLSTAPPDLQRLTRSCHRLFPVSDFLRRELIRLGCVDDKDPRVSILPMPLNLPDHQARHRGEHLICVARPTDRKGIDRAIKIAAATHRKLELIGPKSGPPGTVAYGTLPRRQTLEKVAKAQAILLTPRLRQDGRGGEGLGLCILEAASLGVPAIGCDTGGVIEALGPGLVLSDPDRPDGTAINTWLNEANRGVEALAWVKQHHGARHTVQCLEEALG